MLNCTIRLGVILGVCLAAAAALANDPFDNIASDQEVGYLYRVQAGPGWNGGPRQGPYWGPGGDPVRGMRVGSPYYWSAPGYAGPGFGYAGGPGSFGDAYGYGEFAWDFSGGPGLSPVADPYLYHFGPGFHRHSNYGHFRFPYSSYRSPWYFPGPPSYNRDTNMPW